MSHVSKSQRAKIFDLWGARGVVTVFAEAADALADVAEFVEGESAEVAGALADVAIAFADGVAFCSAFCLLDEVAALGVATVFAEAADALAEVAALGALVELPHVSLNSRSDCSSRSNSSWSGTPCGA